MFASAKLFFRSKNYSHRVACFMVLIGVLGSWTNAAFSSDKLVILSPHRKSLQDEFVPLFKEHYQKTYGTSVEVDWLDQGGTSNAIRFLRTKLAGGNTTAGVDVFWGGPSAGYIDLSRDGILQSWQLPKDLEKAIPPTCAGIPLRDAASQWHASAISSFGILFNKSLMQIEKVAEPKIWADLAEPGMFGKVAVADPRNSGTNSTMNLIVLQSLGWEKGWNTLAGIIANTKKVSASSSDPIRAVETGDAIAALAIDFYGLAKVQEIGSERLGFVLPHGQTILDSDPVALIKGAPNRVVAERFMTFILGSSAQKILMLKKGEVDGPKVAIHARMAVNKIAYVESDGRRVVPMNPFNEKGFVKFDLEKAARLSRPLNDLVGTVLIDMHRDLVTAWDQAVRSKDQQRLRALAAPFVTEGELLELAGRWDDAVFRNQTINSWTTMAKSRYSGKKATH